MPLELDGKPFSLTAEQTANYTGKKIFRVGTQFIHVNTTGDPEVKPISVAPVHVVMQYPHYKMERGVRMPMGILRYYETKQYNEQTKNHAYTPLFVPIGYKGYIEIEDPELSFFLDNHPYNEVVKKNEQHPNFNTKSTSYFATYDRTRKRDEAFETMELTRNLVNKIMDKQEMDIHNLKAIAEMVVRSAKDFTMVHKIFNTQDWIEKDYRVELARLASTYPVSMDQIMSSMKINYLAWIEKFQSVEVVKLKGNEWVISETGKTDVPIVLVEANTDAIATLCDWFQNYDRLNAKFKKAKGLYEAVTNKRKEKVS